MEEKEVMCFRDEEGNKVELEAIAKVYTLGNEYLILSPNDSKHEDDAFIFRVDVVDEKKEYNLVDTDEEFEAVKKEYKKLLYN